MKNAVGATAKGRADDLTVRSENKVADETGSEESTESTEESSETTLADVRTPWSENRQVFAYLLTLMAVLTAVVVVVSNANVKSVTPVVLETRPLQRKPRRGPALPYELCVSRACQAEGRYLFDLLNWDVDPCDDFYGFVCKGWGAATSDQLLRDEMDSKVARLLGRGAAIPRPLAPLQRLYEQCQDVRTLADSGLVPIRKVLDLVGLPHWPYVMPENRYVPLWTAAARILRATGAETLVHVQPGGTHRSRPGHSLFILKAPRQLVSVHVQETTEKAYLAAARAALAAFRDKLSASLLATEILNLEKRFAGATARETNTTLARLGEYPQLLQFLSQLTGNGVHEGTEVLMSQSFNALITVVGAEPADGVLNYLGFRTAVQLADFLPDSVGRELSVLASLVRNGGPLPRWRTCLRAVEDAAPRRFLRAAAMALRAAGTKPAAALFAESIRDGMMFALNQAPWLDKHSLTMSRQQLSRVRFRLFLPENASLLNFDTTSEKGLLAYSAIHTASFDAGLRAPHPWLGSALDTDCTIDVNTNAVFIPLLLFNFSALTLDELLSFHLPRAGLRLARCMANLLLARKNRWSEAGREGLRRIERCMSVQHGSLKPRSMAVADSLALGPVLRLFRANVHRRRRQDVRLRNAEDLSADHVFFVYYASGFCRQEDDVVSVNAPLWSSVAFQRAFECRPGSPMRPDRACPLWTSVT
ncbi:neprilysin-like [Ornithodoros turicata]|uniref:neprilysin-like n=1 Tax=Ornithodoros turicata TaxID=34597 RepID=UPI003139FDB0